MKLLIIIAASRNIWQFWDKNSHFVATETECWEEFNLSLNSRNTWDCNIFSNNITIADFVSVIVVFQFAHTS